MRTCSWRTGVGSTLGLVVLLPLLASTPLRAQQVQGIVLDEVSLAPVKSAAVSLIGTKGKVVGQELTDSTGRFRVTLPKFGAYAIDVHALGYASFVTHVFVADTSQQVSATVHLAPAPVAMKGLNVTTTALRQELEKVGFYRRKKEGFGYYLTPKQIVEKTVDQLTDVFYGLPGVRVVCDPGDATTCDITVHGARTHLNPEAGAYRCYPSVYLDGDMIRHGGNTPFINANAGAWTQILSPYDVAGIEVYTNPGGLPAFAGGSDSPCGTILIWTKDH